MNHPMNVLRTISMAIFALAALTISVSGCSSSDDNGSDDPIDSGIVADSGPEDTGVVLDAGLRDLCPVDDNFATGMAECMMATDCSASPDLMGPSNCEFCRTFNNTVCVLGRCEKPSLIASEGNGNALF